jgi:hypothetical protein
MGLRAEMAGSEVLICVGRYANYIGVLTARQSIQDSRNLIVFVKNVYIEYPPSALRIWPSGRREAGIVRPEDTYPTGVYTMSALGITAATYAHSYERVEFDRIKTARRGSVRLERANDYVIVAHCHTISLIVNTPIRDTRWYVSISFNERQIARMETNDTDFTYDALETFIASAITTHQKELLQ